MTVCFDVDLNYVPLFFLVTSSKKAQMKESKKKQFNQYSSHLNYP